MGTPTVSVLTPVYKGAAFIGEAIFSMMAQSYPHWELFLVDDCSPDNSADIIQQFTDPRIKYIRHEQNKGADEARRTGLRASKGDIIAFLDQDDRFHQEKLFEHVRLFEQNPQAGVTYNARFELSHPSQTVNGIWQPPKEIGLSDLVLGFPFSPSDTMFRRKWALLDEVWDSSFVAHGKEVIVNGGEIVFFGRMYLAGCRFVGTQRALNYRRYHTRRVYSDLAQRCRSERTCQEIILSDPRCPEEVRMMHPVALMNTYLVWAGYAFAQGENGLGGEYLANAGVYNPVILQGKPAPIVESLVHLSIADESANHEDLLITMFNHFPKEMAHLRVQLDWAIKRGYLLKGVKALLWDQFELGAYCMHRAIALGTEIDESFVERLNFQIYNYEREFGRESAQTAMARWKPFLDALGNERTMRRLLGKTSANQALSSYHSGNYAIVPAKVFQAIRNDPRMATNRGMLSILVKSVLSSPFKWKAAAK